jgi:hypothetical protein
MPTNPTTEVSDAGRRLDLLSKAEHFTGWFMLGAILPSGGYVSICYRVEENNLPGLEIGELFWPPAFLYNENILETGRFS